MVELMVEIDMRKRQTNWLRTIGFAGVLFFLASAFTPFPNFLARWMRTPPEVRPADAVVVLGAGISPDGTLSRPSLRRMLHGILLQRKGFAPVLVFLGPAVSGGPPEAEVRAALARELGVPPEEILTDTQARTTREEAARVKALLAPRGARRILLVTDSQHTVRARRLFERAGFEVLPSPVDDLSAAADSPEDRLELMERVLQELIARFYYRIAGYL